MFYFFIENTTRLFHSLYEKYKSRVSLNTHDYDYILNECLDYMEMPRPSNDLYKYFNNPKIIYMILLQIFNHERLTYDDREKLSKYFDHLRSLLATKNSNYFIQYRILGSQGYYPDIEFKKGNWNYVIQNMVPILITKNKYSTEYEYLNDSEIGWITRNELKITTAIHIALEQGYSHFYFTDYNKYRLDYSVLEAVPSKIRLQFLSEIMALTNRFIPLDKSYYKREPTADVTTYLYRSFEESIDMVYKLTDSFSIRNHLLLRTATHLLKAIMLWQNRSFGEEAISNTFFCIEGCLHLLQNKFGDHSPKLNLVLLKKIFIENFPLGEQIFESIKESYETRVQLVHPVTEWGSKWNPYIMSDDFYANYSFCRVLLNYILIDRIIEE